MKNTILDRVPPHDTNAEEAILCSLMTFEKDPKQVSFLKPEDFYSKRLRKIFKAIKILSSENNPTDIVAVAHKLDEMNELEPVGGVAYMASIIDSAPMAVNFKHYAQIVKDCATQRQVIMAAQKVVDAAMINKMPVNELVSMAQSSMLGISVSGQDDRIIDATTYAVEGMDYIDGLCSGCNPDRLKTGFSRFDAIVNLVGPLLIIISARPGIGKTAFMMTLARNMVRMENKIGIISLEMPKEQLFLRHLAVEANINLSRFSLPDGTKGALTPEERSKLESKAKFISRLPLFVDDSMATIDDLKRKSRIMVDNYGVQGIFIDQLSKLSGGKGKDYEKYTRWVNEIALLKKELGIPIFLLAQTNRNISDRVDKMPTLSDLKQTGAIEEDADMVFFINRPGVFDETTDKSVAEINLAKHRMGATWRHRGVVFNEGTTYFSEDLTRGAA